MFILAKCKYTQCFHICLLIISPHLLNTTVLFKKCNHLLKSWLRYSWNLDKSGRKTMLPTNELIKAYIFINHKIYLIFIDKTITSCTLCNEIKHFSWPVIGIINIKWSWTITMLHSTSVSKCTSVNRRGFKLYTCHNHQIFKYSALI